VLLEHHKVGTGQPALGTPELSSAVVPCQQEKIALEDSGLRQSGKTALHEAASEAALPMVGIDRQVMQTATATVVPAKDRGDEPTLVAGDSAETGIPQEIGAQLCGRVRLVQYEAFGLPPELEGGREIGGEQRLDLIARRRLVRGLLIWRLLVWGHHES
jgi:hypothetical protein